MPELQIPLPISDGSNGLLSRAQAARFLGISESYLKSLDLEGKGPRRVRLGRRSLYRPRDLEDFAARHAQAEGVDRA